MIAWRGVVAGSKFGWNFDRILRVVSRPRNRAVTLFIPPQPLWFRVSVPVVIQFAHQRRQPKHDRLQGKKLRRRSLVSPPTDHSPEGSLEEHQSFPTRDFHPDFTYSGLQNRCRGFLRTRAFCARTFCQAFACALSIAHPLAAHQRLSLLRA